MSEPLTGAQEEQVREIARQEIALAEHGPLLVVPRPHEDWIAEVTEPISYSPPRIEWGFVGAAVVVLIMAALVALGVYTVVAWLT